MEELKIFEDGKEMFTVCIKAVLGLGCIIVPYFILTGMMSLESASGGWRIFYTSVLITSFYATLFILLGRSNNKVGEIALLSAAISMLPYLHGSLIGFDEWPTGVGGIWFFYAASIYMLTLAWNKLYNMASALSACAFLFFSASFYLIFTFCPSLMGLMAVCLAFAVIALVVFLCQIRKI